MGSIVEMNDTLQITREQGFPVALDFATHSKTPYTAAQFQGKIFTFQHKSGIRNYQIPPVRNFLVENKNGKWIYWGLIHVLSIIHDYKNKTTSGSFEIIYINTPEEMKQAHELIDRNPETNYFV